MSRPALAGLDLWRLFFTMTKISYAGYHFPPEIIQRAIWVYLRFSLSFRGVEDLLAERGISVSYETVRRWVNHFGPKIAADLRRRRPKPHTTWHLDEVYLKIDGRMRLDQHVGQQNEKTAERRALSRLRIEAVADDAATHAAGLGRCIIFCDLGFPAEVIYIVNSHRRHKCEKPSSIR